MLSAAALAARRTARGSSRRAVLVRAVAAGAAAREPCARASSLASAAAAAARNHARAGAGAGRATRALTSSWQEVNITRGGHNPLIEAVKRGDRDAVFRIGSERFTANVDGADASRVTALMYAAKNGDAVVSRFLVQSLRADVRRRDADHSTALHYAAKFHHPTVTQLLLDAGASPADADAWGRTPLHWAAMTGDTDTCRLLCTAGAPLDARDKNGHTPVNVAANVDQLHICALIKQTARDRAAAATAGAPPHTATVSTATHSVTIGCYPDAPLPPPTADAARESPEATELVPPKSAPKSEPKQPLPKSGSAGDSAGAARQRAIAAAVSPAVKAEAARMDWIRRQCGAIGAAAAGQHYAPAHCDEHEPNATAGAGSGSASVPAAAKHNTGDAHGSAEKWWCDDAHPQSAPAPAPRADEPWDTSDRDASASDGSGAEVVESRSDWAYGRGRGPCDADASDADAAYERDCEPIGRAEFEAQEMALRDSIDALQDRVAKAEDDLRLQARRIDHLVVRLSRVGAAEERDQTDRSDDDLPRTPR